TLTYLGTDEFGNFVDLRTEQRFDLSGSGLGLEDEAFRRRRLNLTVDATRGRNRFGASAYFEERDFGRDAELEEAYGAAANWTRDLSRVTDLSVTLRYRNVRRTGADLERERVYFAGLRLGYELGPTLRLAGGYDFVRRTSSRPGRDMTENVALVGLKKTF
ncbi:MAG TPA: hypothetical protein VEJ18_04920, partial [Planctomycetota bacterium]|nr:hypothetical protein [Planctomycetota bacterium]